jgi:hypothetical protein
LNLQANDDLVFIIGHFRENIFLNEDVTSFEMAAGMVLLLPFLLKYKFVV